MKKFKKQYFVALGVKRHLVEWGLDKSSIQEFDWWDDANFADIKITFTPTRHFSGRGLKDRTKSLWGGWVFNTENETIWFSGDGGYGNHFTEIGEKFGPFDFAFMECGQYNDKWRAIHMFPDESVQAAIDATVKKAMPVHWAGFALSQHSWTEPIEEFRKNALLKKLDINYPKLGQIVSLDKEVSTEEWWNVI